MMLLEEKINNKKAKIGIVGLGYVGLPLALAFAEAGFHVLGFDVMQEKVDQINRGDSYIADVPDARLSSVVTRKLLQATADQNKLGEVDVFCICVPTPLTRTKDPDLSSVLSAAGEISGHLRPQNLVILESTTYPGTTRELLLPTLEKSGLKAGSGFYLAFSPERVDPGNRKYTLKNTPKIVGGFDPESTRLAELLYRQVADSVVVVSCLEIAEITKVFENVFRSVNIALVNELALLCEKMGISVWEVIDAAATKPYGYMPFYPGPGIGGHCIPLDPYYLASKAREYDFHTRFIELAAEINEQMPYYIVSRIIEALNTVGKSLKDSRLLIMGVAYKKDVGDTRESPCLKVMEILAAKGAMLAYHDPYVDQVQVQKEILFSVELTDEKLRSADCVVIGTDHSCYDYKHIAEISGLVFDSRGSTRSLMTNNVVRL